MIYFIYHHAVKGDQIIFFLGSKNVRNIMEYFKECIFKHSTGKLFYSLKLANN